MLLISPTHPLRAERLGCKFEEIASANLLWLDSSGFYLGVRQALAADDTILRIPFARPVQEGRDAKSALTMMAQVRVWGCMRRAGSGGRSGCSCPYLGVRGTLPGNLASSLLSLLATVYTPSCPFAGSMGESAAVQPRFSGRFVTAAEPLTSVAVRAWSLFVHRCCADEHEYYLTSTVFS